MLVNQEIQSSKCPAWDRYLHRYREGGYRAALIRDILLDEVQAFGNGATVVDIGCGRGLDGDHRLQLPIAAQAGKYIGIEPDPSIPLAKYFTGTHRTLFEDAPLEPNSVHLAFAVMVLEHVRVPEQFWDKLHSVLAPGGVFWGFTMDRRHWFCKASVWTEKLAIKDLYLNWLHGRRGTDRYENYPVHYRTNTPEDVACYTGAFRQCETVSFARQGQLRYYLPHRLHRLADGLDRRAISKNRPGMLLAIRAVK